MPLGGFTPPDATAFGNGRGRAREGSGRYFALQAFSHAAMGVSMALY